MTIVEAVTDENLFRPYLASDGDLSSWRNWLVCLKCIYGLSLSSDELSLVKECTGRSKLGPKGFDKVLLLVGRRGGKSKIAGLIAAFEGRLSGREKVLSPGEIGMVSVVSPTRDQSQIIKSYTRAALSSDLLDREVVDDKREVFELANGVAVRTLTGSFRSVRGYTQLSVVVDEVCYFHLSEECASKSDTEVVRAIRPSLLTTHGRLVCVSTKYAPKGWAYSQWRRNFGNDEGRVLVWDATSRLMNPTLSESDIQEAMDDDPAAARAEYMNEWREDVETYLPVEVVRACVVAGRRELLARQGVGYCGFCDVSGGRFDSASLCIGHKDGRKTVIDLVREYRAPFSPFSVAGFMAKELKRYGLSCVTGDRYSAEYTVGSFKAHGIRYETSVKSKSELYLELVGPICSREVELPDDDKLIGQIASLERRPRSGGKDSVDHPAGLHDDLANSVAGCVSMVARPAPFVGVF
jgi:hypothetical protein